MNRRASIERLTLMLGGAALSPQITAGLMGQVTNSGSSVEVTPEMEALLAEAADVIIPDTDTPGAKAAGAEQFIIRVLRDCHELEKQQWFYGGLEKLDADSRSAYDGKGFVDLNAESKNAMMTRTVKEQKEFFKELKRQTVVGYFTSEIGATEALAYLPIPGQFIGDVPLKEGQKTWAL